MRMQIFAIYDHVARTYTTPFFQHNKEMAIRAFGNMTSNDQTQYGQNPEDYTLWHIGEYDDETADITPMKDNLIHGDII